MGEFLKLILGALATFAAIQQSHAAESSSQINSFATNPNMPELTPIPLTFSAATSRYLSAAKAACPPEDLKKECIRVALNQEALNQLIKAEATLSNLSFTIDGHNVRGMVSKIENQIRKQAKTNKRRGLRGGDSEEDDQGDVDHSYRSIRVDLPGMQSEQAYFVIEDDTRVYASIWGPDGTLFLIQPCAESGDITCHTQFVLGRNEQKELRKMDNAEHPLTVPPQAVQTAVNQQQATEPPATREVHQQGSGGRLLAMQKKYFRISVGYTTAVTDQISENNLNGQGMLYVNSLNKALRDSGLSDQLEFEFHTAFGLQYSASDSYTDLRNIRDVDARGGDILALMFSPGENGSTCGRAFLDCGLQGTTPELMTRCMRLVVNTACALSRYTFAHEVMHLFGAEHQAAYANPSARVPDNHGFLYVLPEGHPWYNLYYAVATIMGYDGDVRVSRFSETGATLTTTFGGVTGTMPVGAPGANNVRVIPLAAEDMAKIWGHILRGGGGGPVTQPPSAATPQVTGAPTSRRPSVAATAAPIAPASTRSPSTLPTTDYPTKAPTKAPTNVPVSVPDNNYLQFTFNPNALNTALVFMVNDLQVTIGDNSLIVRKKQDNNWVRLPGVVVQNAEKININPDELANLNFRISKTGNDISIQLVEITQQKVNKRVINKEVPINVAAFKLSSQADLNINFGNEPVIAQPVKKIPTDAPTPRPTTFPSVGGAVTKAPSKKTATPAPIAKTSKTYVPSKRTTGAPSKKTTRAPSRPGATAFPTTPEPTKPPTPPTKRRSNRG